MLALLLIALALFFACRQALRPEHPLWRASGPATERQKLTLEAASWAAGGLAAYAFAALLGAPVAGAPAALPCAVMAAGAALRLAAHRAGPPPSV